MLNLDTHILVHALEGGRYAYRASAHGRALGSIRNRAL